MFAVLKRGMGIVHAGNVTVTPENIGGVLMTGIDFIAAAAVTADDIAGLVGTVPRIGGQHFLSGVDDFCRVDRDVITGVFACPAAAAW